LLDPDAAKKYSVDAEKFGTQLQRLRNLKPKPSVLQERMQRDGEKPGPDRSKSLTGISSESP